MKKGILFSFMLLLISSVAFSGTTSDELFSYDKNQVEQEFTELNQLEAYVNANQGVTLADVQLEFNSNFNMQSSPLKFDFGDIEWGAFAWGFLCCPVGFFVVVLDDRARKDEKTSFWIGVITNVVINGIINAIYWTAVANAVTTVNTTPTYP